MYERILFPTDGGDAAEAVLDHVLDVAADAGATLHVLFVADTGRDSVTRIGTEVVDALEREGERVAEDVAERAAERGIDAVTAVHQGDPSATIVDDADARDVDLIAMATHGRRGLDRMLLGSVTERVVRRAPSPVLTLRPDEETTFRYPYRSILVPTDGSPVATTALDEALEVARDSGATVHLLSVVDPAVLGYDVQSVMQAEFLDDRAEAILDEAVERAERAGVDVASPAVEYGSVPRTITSYAADAGVDLVVIGTHGRSGLDRYVLGSVAERVVRTAPVPVLTVRGEPAEPDSDGE